MIKQMTGMVFDRLTVINEGTRTASGEHRWNCICSCGKPTLALGKNLRKGHTKSCGCLSSEASRKRATTHGMSDTRPFKIWQGMLKRCLNTNCDAYADYGARGIAVCSSWVESFENFWSDMSGGYSDTLTLERIDTNADYCKPNCKWATMAEQSNNKRNNVRLSLNGRTQNLAQWARELSVSRYLFVNRIRRGWSTERTLTTPKLR